jgi:hypothetical protein
MSEHITQLNERIEKVREFVTSYQETLRSLVASLPADGSLVPLPIVTALGRCEIWPCKDAAVVLTYHDDPDAPVIVRENVHIKFSEFIKEGDPFTYFNEMGESVPIRISFEPNHVGLPPGMNISVDDFSFSRFDFDDLITWGPKAESDVIDLSRTFCRPRFNRLSVFGWNAWFGNPKERARRDFREGFMAKNMPVPSGEELLDSPRRELIFSATKKLINEFESLLDSADNNDPIHGFIIEHPELIHADYLRSYRGTASDDDLEPALIMLIPGEESPEWVTVKLGGVNVSLFTESNDPSEVFAQAKTYLSTCADHITRETEKLVLEPLGNKNLRCLFIMGRNSGLTYYQRKQLREQNSGSNQQIYTYDDLVNRLRFEVNDVTEIRERFLPVDVRLGKLGVKTDQDFNRVMEEIDQEMREEEIPLTARSLEGVLRFSSEYGLSLMNRDPVTVKVNQWFSRRYGDRLNIDMDLGAMGIILRNDTYRMRFPVGYGLNRVICSRELAKDKPSIIIGTHDNPPTLNVLDFVDGLTQDYANSLTDEELEGLFNQFVFGRTAFMRISEVLNSDVLKSQARADLSASTNHLFTNPPNYGLSKWASLQAAEKFIKAFITSKGGDPPRHHRLNELARIAESHGLARMPDQWLDDVQCSAEVRYGGIPVTAQEAIEAQYGALQICEHIANAR